MAFNDPKCLHVAHLYSDSQDAHDGHVVERHPDVLAVIKSRHLDRPGLPGQEGPKQLKCFNQEDSGSVADIDHHSIFPDQLYFHCFLSP